MRVWVLGLSIALLAGGSVAQGEHYVNGYTKADGTYVAPHYQTNPNATRNDNWSTQGNVNPYTGQAGTKPADNGYRRPVYGQPDTRGQSSYGKPTPYTGSSYGAPPPDPYAPQ